jgi:hypothetical protein
MFFIPQLMNPISEGKLIEEQSSTDGASAASAL